MFPSRIFVIVDRGIQLSFKNLYKVLYSLPNNKKSGTKIAYEYAKLYAKNVILI